MSDNKSGTKNFLDWLGGVAAFLTVAVYAVLLIHANWAFLPETLFNVLVVCKTWAPLVVVVIVGLEFTNNKGFLTKLIFYVFVTCLF